MSYSSLLYSPPSEVLPPGRTFDPKRPPSLTSEPIPNLTIRHADLELCEVWETDRHEHVVHVTNPGAEPVKVTSWQTSCDCHKVEPENAIIQPGETLPVRLTLNLMPRISESWTEKPRGISIQFKPRHANGAAMDGWQIAGTVVPFYRLIEEPRSTELSELAQPFSPHWQSIRFLIPVREVIAQADSLITSAKVVAPIDGQVTYRVEFQWQNKLALVSHNASVRIQARKMDGSALPEIALPHRLDVIEDVRMTPPSLLIPLPASGEWVSQQLQFHSLSERHVELKPIDDLPKDSNFTVEISDAIIRVRVRGTPERIPLQRKFHVTVDSSGKVYRLPVLVVVG